MFKECTLHQDCSLSSTQCLIRSIEKSQCGSDIVAKPRFCWRAFYWQSSFTLCTHFALRSVDITCDRIFTSLFIFVFTFSLNRNIVSKDMKLQLPVPNVLLYRILLPLVILGGIVVWIVTEKDILRNLFRGYPYLTGIVPITIISLIFFYRGINQNEKDQESGKTEGGAADDFGTFCTWLLIWMFAMATYCITVFATR